MTTLTLQRPRPKLKQDIEPARWWAVIRGDDGELTKRIEIAWGQDPIHFGLVQRSGYARRIAVFDAENGDTAWLEGFLTPLDTALTLFCSVSVSHICWPGRTFE